MCLKSLKFAYLAVIVKKKFASYFRIGPPTPHHLKTTVEVEVQWFGVDDDVDSFLYVTEMIT